MPRVARRDDGMVTAETALTLPVLFLVAVLATWLVLAGVTALHASDAAEVAAAALARGDSPGAVQAELDRTAPGAEVRVASDSEAVTVTVVLTVPRPTGLSALSALLPVVRVSGTAVAGWGP